MEITRELINEAYEKTSLTPINGAWAEYRSHSIKCACGLSALYISLAVEEKQETVDDVFEALYVSDDPEEIVKEYLHEKGFSSKFTSGFVYGFDGIFTKEESIKNVILKSSNYSEKEKAEYLTGWKIGTELYNDLFNKVEVVKEQD